MRVHVRTCVCPSVRMSTHKKIVIYNPIPKCFQVGYECIKMGSGVMIIMRRILIFILSLSEGFVLSIPLCTVFLESGVSIAPEKMTFHHNMGTPTLTCMTFGGPDNRFQWSFNGVELENETSSILLIHNVTAKDGGAYTCEDTNAAGTDILTTYAFISPMTTLNPI